MDNVNQQVPPVPSQPQVKAANNLNFLKIIAYGFVIVSIGISIAVGGYLLGANKSKPQPVPQVSATPTPTPDPTAGWQTYKNEKYGFEFNYPPNFSQIVDIQSVVAFTDKANTQQRLSTAPDISLRVISIAPGEDFKRILINDVVFDGSGLNPKSFDEFSSKTIGSNTVHSIKSGLFEGILSVNYYLINGNQVFAFRLISSPVDWTNPAFNSENDALNKNLQQILSTFKFTN